MPADILLSEWRALLSTAAAGWCADGGAALDDYRAHWTAPLGGVRVTVGLRTSDGAGLARHMTPEVTIGQSGGMQRDAYQHARVLRDALATIDAATAVHTMLSGYRVYLRDCPCGHCSGRGRADCKVCGGTGLRQEVSDAG